MYDELLSLTSDGSAMTMSPGRPTTIEPPSLISPPADGEGAALDGGVLAAGVAADGDGDAAVPQAANMIAVAATSAPIRRRTMKSPPSSPCSTLRLRRAVRQESRDGRREY
jgi:hypothetical protein